MTGGTDKIDIMTRTVSVTVNNENRSGSSTRKRLQAFYHGLIGYESLTLALRILLPVSVLRGLDG